MSGRVALEIFNVKATMEGAGVSLHRGFSAPELPKFDPFLLFDDFSSDNPMDYLPGFPMHPHRGIETVTYILGGEVRHKDTTGTSGSIGAGDVQWMTAGSGILHEEMPVGEKGLKGFQLWVNLPAKDKMMEPRYQEVKSKEIPDVQLTKATKVKLIAGKLHDADAPVSDIMADPVYMDVIVNSSDEFSLPILEGHNGFLYVFEGSVGLSHDTIREGSIALLSRDGSTVDIKVGSSGARFLFAAGKPLEEPIAWHGPIVMNSQEELVTAVTDLRTNNFIK